MKGQMWPINGASKAKRLKWGAIQSPSNWAYMKMLRETDKTMKVYDVNPYIEVYRFRDNLYGLLAQNCDGGGDVWMFVIIGPEKAMLIDTAYGIGDIPGLVDKITGGIPLIVVNTHTGPDHVLGNVLFDKIYCHEYETENIRNKCQPDAWDYLFDENGKNIWLQFDKKDLPKYKDFELIPVPDGYVFNLGGDYNIELVWTAGHAPGHAMFLDKKNRILFSGDDIHSENSSCGGGPRPGAAYSQYSNLSSYRDCLGRLVKRLDEYDYIFPSHFMVNIESHLVIDFLEALNAIIKDPECYNYKVEYTPGQGGQKQIRMHKYVKGFGTIAYTENGVYPPVAKG